VPCKARGGAPATATASQQAQQQHLFVALQPVFAYPTGCTCCSTAGTRFKKMTVQRSASTTGPCTHSAGAHRGVVCASCAATAAHASCGPISSLWAICSMLKRQRLWLLTWRFCNCPFTCYAFPQHLLATFRSSRVNSMAFELNPEQATLIVTLKCDNGAGSSRKHAVVCSRSLQADACYARQVLL
jgi:hypothetical protein